MHAPAAPFLTKTAKLPAGCGRGNSQTWVKSQWKNPAFPGHFSVEINTERKGRPIVVDLPVVADAAGVVEALARITAAAAGGEITTDEAAALAGLVETQRRAIETQELEARIAALEARK